MDRYIRPDAVPGWLLSAPAVWHLQEQRHPRMVLLQLGNLLPDFSAAALYRWFKADQKVGTIFKASGENRLLTYILLDIFYGLIGIL
jgi:hypothetical protein